MNPFNVPVEVVVLDEGLYDFTAQREDEPAGFDLRIRTPVSLLPGEAKQVGTGIAVQPLARGIFSLITPRSGLGGKEGLVLGNLVGVIDADYQGELSLSLWNRQPPNGSRVTVNRGARVAQLVFLPYYTPSFKVVDEFSAYSRRGTDGFGSTGVL